MAENKYIPLNQRDKLSTGRLFCISLTSLTANFIYIPAGILLNPLMAKLDFSNTVSSLVYLMGTISGLIISPLIGMISDNTTWKIGRRRGYMIIGEVLAVLGMLILGFVDQFTDNYQIRAGACFVGYFVACCGGNTLAIPGRAMATDLTPYSQQIQVSNICTLQQGIASIASAVLSALQLPQYFSGSFGYEQFVLVLCTTLGCVALIVCAFAGEEEQLKEKVSNENLFVSIYNVLKTFNLNIFFLLIAYIFIALGSFQWNTQFAVFFGQVIFKGNPTGTKDEIKLFDDGISYSQYLYCILSVVQIFFCFYSHLLTDKIGLKGTWLLGLICGMAGSGMMNFKVFGQYTFAYYTVACVLWAYFLVTCGIPNSVISLYIDDKAMCCAQGMLNFFYCIGEGLSIVVVQLLFGNYISEQINKGNSFFDPGTLIGISPIPLFISLVFGYIGIARTEKANIGKEKKD